ncbi:MAG: GNAT family N-acetyltransferase [Deltaproteobacteria bacterium]|nr:GNAT family N-acetyltransferase [Deltaproteobacteria bacterium]
MSARLRRLGPDDVAVLRRLTIDDALFDLDGRGGDREPLADLDARAFLSDPAVLVWIAESEAGVIGFLFCHTLRMRSNEPPELLLYEIGVHREHRRLGHGRALLEAMFAWMRAEGIETVWVGADNPGAVAFYRACGFGEHVEGAVFMDRTLVAEVR